MDKNDQTILVSIPQRLPARLHATEAAKVLGFSDVAIQILMRHKLLIPLGKPPQSAPKFFATRYIEEKAANPEWLHKATRVTQDHWKDKQDRKTANQVALAA